jgi:hypothetical protein
MEDMPEIKELAAVGARGVIRGCGSVAEGIISLEGVACDNLEGGALEAARVGLEYPLDERVEVIRVGGLGEGCVGWIRFTRFVIFVPFFEHSRL